MPRPPRPWLGASCHRARGGGGQGSSLGRAGALPMGTRPELSSSTSSLALVPTSVCANRAVFLAFYVRRRLNALDAPSDSACGELQRVASGPFVLTDVIIGCQQYLTHEVHLWVVPPPERRHFARRFPERASAGGGQPVSGLAEPFASRHARSAVALTRRPGKMLPRGRRFHRHRSRCTCRGWPRRLQRCIALLWSVGASTPGR
jgi:hypothetical protein